MVCFCQLPMKARIAATANHNNLWTICHITSKIEEILKVRINSYEGFTQFFGCFVGLFPCDNFTYYFCGSGHLLDAGLL